MYLHTREGLGQIPTTLQPRNLTRSGYAFGPGPSAVEGFGQPGSPTQPTSPVFDVQCPNPPGCPPVAAGQCGTVLRQAIIEAIKLAENAASKIEATIQTEPNKRDEEGKETASFYKTFFGHDPSRPISWAGNQASGISVAKRFRGVARELAGGRRIVFRCIPATCPPGTATTQGTLTTPPCCAVNTRAFFVRRTPALRNVIHLCPEFWDPPAGLLGLSPGLSLEAFRGGTIIHEMLHLLYPEFLVHDFRRPNAHCYKAFALRVKGYGRDFMATCHCWGLPPGAACRQRIGI
jgi:hypothetical protein